MFRHLNIACQTTDSSICMQLAGQYYICPFAQTCLKLWSYWSLGKMEEYEREKSEKW